jgi:hypothetical protein
MKIIDINGIERECASVALDKEYPGYVKVNFVSKVRKGYKHSEWFPIEKFFAKNRKLKGKIGKAQSSPKEDLGIVSKSGKDFIQDISKNWNKNLYAGYPLWISRGKGEGQQRTVTKNNKNILYVDKEWDLRPDRTSQYVLSRNVQKNIEAYGNILPGLETKKMMDDIIKKAKIASNEE